MWKKDKAMPDKTAASKAKRQRQDEGSSPDAAMFDLEPDHEPEATIETADEVEPKNDKKKQSTPKGKQPAAKAKQTQEDIKGKGKQIQEDIKGKGKEIQENIEDMGNISERKQQKQLPEVSTSRPFIH
jgi:hypothetical protein